MLKISHLGKHYGENIILEDINLDIEKGDVYGILGLSGAGKSTLVRCMNGLESPDEGKVIFKDKVISSATVTLSKEDRTKIAMIFQSFNLLNQKNVIQNVELPLFFQHKKISYSRNEVKNIKEHYNNLIKQTNDKEEKIKLKHTLQFEVAKIKHHDAFVALDKVGLSNKWDAFPSSLSGGQQQRVAIARSLMTSPEVLLCDEATSALDPETTSSILELLKELNHDLGLTIIIISHQMSVIETICNKVAVIDKAKIAEKGLLADIFLNPKTEIAKKLIYSNKVATKLDKTNCIRLVFNGNVDEPLITNIVQDCNILVSIVMADSKVIEGKTYGQMVIRLPYYDDDIVKLKKYLDLKKVSYEEVTWNGLK